MEARGLRGKVPLAPGGGGGGAAARAGASLRVPEPHGNGISLPLLPGARGQPPRRGSRRRGWGYGAAGGVFIATFDTGAHYAYMVRRHGAVLAGHAALQAIRTPALAREFLETRSARYLRGVLRFLIHREKAPAKSSAGWASRPTSRRPARRRRRGRAVRSLRGDGPRSRPPAPGAGNTSGRQGGGPLLREARIHLPGGSRQPQRRALRPLRQIPRRRGSGLTLRVPAWVRICAP